MPNRRNEGVRTIPQNEGFFAIIFGALWAFVAGCLQIFVTNEILCHHLWRFVGICCWLSTNFRYKRVMKEAGASFVTLIISCLVSTIAFALPEISTLRAVLTWGVGPLVSGFSAWVSFYLIGRRYPDTHGYTMVTLAFIVYSPSPTFVRAQVPSYILGQILGTEASTWSVKLITLVFKKLGFLPHIKLICPTLCVDSMGLCIAAEFSLTIVRVFTQYRFAGREWDGSRGWITGCFITALIGSSGHVTGGSMNTLRTLGAFIASNVYPFWYVFVAGPLPACLICALVLRYCGPELSTPPTAPPNSPSGSPPPHRPLTPSLGPSSGVPLRQYPSPRGSFSPSSRGGMSGGGGSLYRAAPDLTHVMGSPSSPRFLPPVSSPSGVSRPSTEHSHDVMDSGASPSALPRASSSTRSLSIDAPDHCREVMDSPLSSRRPSLGSGAFFSGVARSSTRSFPSGASPSSSTESVSRVPPEHTTSRHPLHIGSPSRSADIIAGEYDDIDQTAIPSAPPHDVMVVDPSPDAK